MRHTRRPLSLSAIALCLTVGAPALLVAASASAQVASIPTEPGYASEPRISCTTRGAMVVLHGSVDASKAWHTVGTLPYPCRPPKAIVLNANLVSEAARVRVDIAPDGRMSLLSIADPGVVSLDGLSFARALGTPLRNTPNATSYGFKYGSIRYVVDGDVVMLGGLVRSVEGQWGPVATLPPEARPRERLVFEANAHPNAVRVDVLADGTVTVDPATGPIEFNWVSLDGITFSRGPIEALEVRGGYTPAPGFAGPGVAALGAVACLQGGVEHEGAWDRVGALPYGVAPLASATFEANHHATAARLTLERTGGISIRATQDGGLVSLSGMCFPIDGRLPIARELDEAAGTTWANADLKLHPATLPLGLDWSYRDYGGAYGPPAVAWNGHGQSGTHPGAIATLGGVLRGSGSGEVALIWQDRARPAFDHVVGVRTSAGAARVDVRASGHVVVMRGTIGEAEWVSLSNVTIPLRQGELLPLAEGRSAWAAHVYGQVRYLLDGGLVALSGCVSVGANFHGLLATLPEGARPESLLSFEANTHDDGVQVDVHPDGRVVVVEGTGRALRGFVSLSGLVFPTDQGTPIQLSRDVDTRSTMADLPRVHTSENLACLTGALKHRVGEPLSYLGRVPAEQRPHRHEIFDLNEGVTSVRVDLLPDGRLFAVQPQTGPWVSLSGACWDVGPTPPPRGMTNPVR